MKRRLCCRIFFTCGNVLAAKRQFVFVVVVEKRIDKLCWSILFVQVALCTKHTHGNDEMSCTSISKEKVKTPGFFERLFGGKSSQTCDNNISRTSTSMSLPGKTSSHLHELREVTKSTTDYHAATPSSSTQSRQERRRSSVSGRRRDRSRGVCSASASLATTTDHSVEYPATPETILARHCARPFLDADELAVLEELNEFECLVDGVAVIRAAAQHARYYGADLAQM